MPARAWHSGWPKGRAKAISHSHSTQTVGETPLSLSSLPPAKQADRFARARAVQSMALLEDYVELIGDLIAELGEARVADIAERMGVAQPTATKAIARLKRQGLATSRPYRGVFLTEEGAILADRVRARHRTVVELLVAVGVPRETAEIDAEGIEHHVSDRSLAAFAGYLKRNGGGGKST
ncbi:MAG: manganese-binding transcriptional regulator MntR [Geminicoccaceae bacterium]|nr:manganese-binding transcriptional regulator MntR [Geminicoccaceae bacterium]